ncbi:hypothetical protein ACTQZK_00525 [Paraeggerthella sp. LCP19S3_G8]|uniref:hypothetical protein n=1 Tax=Paraeggerthella sp. LCP19S3_G8 TaxID=3440248 RepID=UPI002A8FC297|nr:hypothetical protein [Paraeggerthella sp.]
MDKSLTRHDEKRPSIILLRKAKNRRKTRSIWQRFDPPVRSTCSRAGERQANGSGLRLASMFFVRLRPVARAFRAGFKVHWSTLVRALCDGRIRNKAASRPSRLFVLLG